MHVTEHNDAPWKRRLEPSIRRRPYAARRSSVEPAFSFDLGSPPLPEAAAIEAEPARTEFHPETTSRVLVVEAAAFSLLRMMLHWLNC
jgi:hypothetical protein